MVGDSVEVGLGVDREVGAFGEPASDKAVGVLVGWALPWFVGVVEVDVDSGGLGDGGVVGHLAAAIPGEGQSQLGWDRFEGGGEGVLGAQSGVGTVGCVVAGEPQVPGFAVDEGDDGGLVAGADDLVAFEVTDLCPCLGGGWAVVDDVELAENAGSLLAMALTGVSASWTTAVQHLVDLGGQAVTFRGVDALVDRFVGDVGGVAVEALGQLDRDRHRRISGHETFGHLPRQFGFSDQHRCFWSQSCLVSSDLRFGRGVRGSATVAGDLASDRAAMTSQPAGDTGVGVTAFDPSADLLTIRRGEWVSWHAGTLHRFRVLCRQRPSWPPSRSDRWRPITSRCCRHPLNPPTPPKWGQIRPAFSVIINAYDWIPEFRMDK